MKKSPWAKLRMPSTPNRSASPAATSASEAPTTRPLRAATTTCSTRSAPLLQVRLDEPLCRREVVELVLAGDPSLLHHVHAAAHRLQQLERRVHDQDAGALLHGPAQRRPDQVDVDR